MDDKTVKKEKRKTSFLGDVHFLSHLITSVVVSLVLLGLVILGLPHFGPKMERLISPSIVRIDDFQKDINTLGEKIEGLEHHLQSHKEKLSEIEALKSQIGEMKGALTSFSKSLSELEGKFEKFRQLTPQGQLNFLQEGLNQLQQRIDKGEAFSEILHALISKVTSDKDLMEVVHKLTVYANAPTKTLSVLIQELQLIREQVSAEKKDGSLIVEDKTWWARLKSKITSLVSVHKVGGDEKERDVHQGSEQEILGQIDRILNHLKEQNLTAALELTRTQSGQYKCLFSSWLQDAERRKSLEEVFSLFKKQLAPLLTRSS